MEKDVFFIPDRYGDTHYVLMQHETYRKLTEKGNFDDMTISELSVFISNLKRFFTEYQGMFRLLMGAEEFGKTFEAMAHTECDDENCD